MNGRRSFIGGVLSLTSCGVVGRVDRRHVQRAQRRGYRSMTVHAGADRVHARVHPGPRFAAAARPLVFVHGFGGTALFQWEQQMELFSRFRRVVVPDLLWFGDSTSTDRDPTLGHQAAALHAVVERLGVEAVDLVGLSYGGFVCLEFARAFPGRVGDLVMVDSPGPAWSPAHHQAMLDRFGARCAADLFVPSSPEDIRTLLALAVSEPPGVPAFAARQAIATYYDPHRAQLRRLLDELEANMASLLAAGMPAVERGLVIWGEDDPVFDVSVASTLATMMHANLVVLPGARHLSSADAPVAFNCALLEFLVL